MASGNRDVTEIMKEYVRCRRKARELRKLNDHSTAYVWVAKANAYFHAAKIVQG